MKKLEKETYIIGVSGGPDSMALLDMCRKQGYNLVVAHMNYGKRDTADRDMKIVQDYCATFHIPCEIVRQTKPCKGNFQAFAREERYRMYKELLTKYQAKAILLAHHMDDHIETYLMAKKRGSLKTYLGIEEETVIMDCRVIRPCLMYTKQDLETYCKENAIPYGIDESNLSNDYERNRIRHSVIDAMTKEDKRKLLQTIDHENRKLKELRVNVKEFLNTWDYSMESLCLLDESFMKEVLLYWVYEECGNYLSMQEVSLLCELVRKQSNGWTRVLFKEYDMYSEYGKLVIDSKDKKQYSYTYDRTEFIKTPYFEIAPKGSSVEAVTLHEDDFPITIRNVEEHDVIELRFGNKKINRWFIDRKIPKKERKIWPVVVNAKGNVILVPKIGCDIAHFSNNPTIFVLK